MRLRWSVGRGRPWEGTDEGTQGIAVGTRVLARVRGAYDAREYRGTWVHVAVGLLRWEGRAKQNGAMNRWARKAWHWRILCACCGAVLRSTQHSTDRYRAGLAWAPLFLLHIRLCHQSASSSLELWLRFSVCDFSSPHRSLSLCLKLGQTTVCSATLEDTLEEDSPSRSDLDFRGGRNGQNGVVVCGCTLLLTSVSDFSHPVTAPCLA